MDNQLRLKGKEYIPANHNRIKDIPRIESADESLKLKGFKKQAIPLGLLIPVTIQGIP